MRADHDARPGLQGSRPFTRCRPALGTFVEISILDDRTEDHERFRAVTAAFAAVERVAALMSFHDPASDLSRINDCAADRPVRVHPWTYEVLTLAGRLFVATDGHFDCTIAPVLVANGWLPRPSGTQIRADDCDGTFDDVSLIDGSHVAFRTPLCIDLGGIAKGYAVDRAIEALQSRGIASAVVNAGGDLRVLGATPVPILVRRIDSSVSMTLAGALADGAFATSCAYRESGQGPVQAVSALVRPKDRHVIEGRRRYSIIAPTCAPADALTKALASSGGLSPACLERFEATQMIH